MGSVGPFALIKDQEIEVLIGYEVDRSTTPLGGITAVRAISDAVQEFYENNFGYPIVSVEDEIPIVTEFKLEQNFPNPFNPSTKIKFTIPSVERIPRIVFTTLKVYDVLGNEIATLVNEELSAGEYEVEFSPESSIKNPASGIYFYTLRSGLFIQTKKMILLK
ncbi:MAG: T9SS type A sorting domain-containing protein [bacterium]|nr:T9SS type A sorting domain-containing protein [bacterium]